MTPRRQAFRPRRDHEVDAMGEIVGFARLFRRREDGGQSGVARRVAESPADRRLGFRFLAGGGRADVDADQPRPVRLGQ